MVPKGCPWAAHRLLGNNRESQKTVKLCLQIGRRGQPRIVCPAGQALKMEHMIKIFLHRYRLRSLMMASLPRKEIENEAWKRRKNDPPEGQETFRKDSDQDTWYEMQLTQEKIKRDFLRLFPHLQKDWNSKSEQLPFLQISVGSESFIYRALLPCSQLSSGFSGLWGGSGIPGTAWNRCLISASTHMVGCRCLSSAHPTVLTFPLYLYWML
ncbi:PREDICTED: uncharacterized protein LOC102020892 [Chinchilla lanigera]|uniref:uncharacterized protein LOC102020892 n=1 Tax=Chinchilla lanigera TaxID=34839 RepID=UPI00038EE1C4|nr:PREDICTED: uncharacterized protein LOC102020892 [Chinchilla lanigera]